MNARRVTFGSTQSNPALPMYIFDFLSDCRSISAIGAMHACRGRHWIATATGLGWMPN